MTYRMLTLNLTQEQDVVLARQRTRHIAQLLGFSGQDQTRLATAVSEIARNAFVYAGGGKVQFSIEGQHAPQILLVNVSDTGPGIANLREILAGRYRSETGMGIGLLGATRLMDHCDIKSGAQGTSIDLKKIFPSSVPVATPLRLGEMSRRLLAGSASSNLEEIQQHNQELLRALEEVRERQQQLLQLTAELEDTNRGVVALYAELDEKAAHLRRADEMKSRFLSNMSHEFRTPLSSIRALSKLLLNRVDGDLTGEQEKQVGFILRGTEELSELVNDLLDLAKIEAGKTEVHADTFEVSTLFSALRGMLRPLLTTNNVELVFQESDGLPALYGDEGKISQILRNLVSNALKFTERGMVEVSAALSDDGRYVQFRVRDTGIGIAQENIPFIFEEFTQLENSLQKSAKGTGLGLPLCRKLAELMNGSIQAESTVGAGSTFTATIPVRHAPDQTPEDHVSGQVATQPGATRPVVLIVENNPYPEGIYDKYLQGTSYQTMSVASVNEARNVLRTTLPMAIVLDIALPSEESWRFLAELKNPATTGAIPVIVASDSDDVKKGFALGADAYFIKPVDREDLLSAIDGLYPDTVTVPDHERVGSPSYTEAHARG
jgi:signal transduction histidine kinase/ActR/RegA family two-component response regulator